MDLRGPYALPLTMKDRGKQGWCKRGHFIAALEAKCFGTMPVYIKSAVHFLSNAHLIA